MSDRTQCFVTSALTLWLGDWQLITGREGREGLREQGKLKANFKILLVLPVISILKALIASLDFT